MGNKQISTQIYEIDRSQSYRMNLKVEGQELNETLIFRPGERIEGTIKLDMRGENRPGSLFAGVFGICLWQNQETNENGQ